MLKFAAIFFAFLVPVAMSQTTTSGLPTSSVAPTCQSICNKDAESCLAAADEQGDGACYQTADDCSDKCALAAKNACQVAANKTYNASVKAARVKFQLTKVTVAHAMQNARVVLNQKNINKAFPGLQGVRDKAIKAAKDKLDQTMASKACN